MKIFKILLFSLIAVIAFYSCKKDYVIGGSVFNPNVNMTTYDYLKTNHLFDTLVIMIDKTGLKEEVNSSGTFFAVTNYSIKSYITQKRDQVRIEKDDENYPYTFDSLDFSMLKDSLRAYMFKEKLAIDNLQPKGVFATSNDGEKRLVESFTTTNYTNGIFTTPPKYIYLTKIVATSENKPLPTNLDEALQVDDDQQLYTLCQTTGIITTTGILHVLNNGHTFTYFNDNQ
jgi:hypothetical protein